jgi:hypothetical protein
MLMKFLGLCLLAAGGLAAMIMLGGLIGIALGLVWFVIKFAVPLLLIYVGYRLLTRDKHRIAY